MIEIAIGLFGILNDIRKMTSSPDPAKLKKLLENKIDKVNTIDCSSLCNNLEPRNLELQDSTFENLFNLRFEIRGYQLSQSTKQLIQTLQKSGDSEHVKNLINKKLDNNISYFQFLTCYGSKWEDIEFLIDAGGDLNTPHDNGNSAVHYIAANKKLPLTKVKIKYLIDHKANFDIKNINNITPLNASMFYLATLDQKINFAINILRELNHLEQIMLRNDPDKNSIGVLLDEGFKIDFEAAFGFLYSIICYSTISKPQTICKKLIHNYISEKNTNNLDEKDFLANDEFIVNFNDDLKKAHKTFLNEERNIESCISQKHNNLKELTNQWNSVDHHIEVITECLHYLGVDHNIQFITECLHYLEISGVTSDDINPD